MIYDLIVLGGGPAGYLAAERAGHDVEYILCSGDPDSLDAVVFPALNTAIVDGTAPHG